MESISLRGACADLRLPPIPAYLAMQFFRPSVAAAGGVCEGDSCFAALLLRRSAKNLQLNLVPSSCFAIEPKRPIAKRGEVGKQEKQDCKLAKREDEALLQTYK